VFAGWQICFEVWWIYYKCCLYHCFNLWFMLPLIIYCLCEIRAVLDFHRTHTFVHNKFSPITCLAYAKFGRLYTAGKQTFQAVTNGALKLSLKLYFVSTKYQKGLSQWPHSWKCRFVVAHSLRLRVRSHQRHGYLAVVSVVYSQVDVSKAGFTWGYFTWYLLSSVAS